MSIAEESLSNGHDLPHPVQEALAEALDQYAQFLEAGNEVAAAALLEQHPLLTEKFAGPLQSLQMLCRATQRRPPVTALSEEAEGHYLQTELGDYRIEKEIGRGGMGIVYSATQLSLRRRVALKILPFAAVLDQQQVTRFRHEAQAAASLHHPHIVPVYAVGCERGVHYYSMQLIEGQSLEQAIEQWRAREASFATSASGKHPERRDSKSNDATVRSGDITTAMSIRTQNFIRAAVVLGIHVAEALDAAHRQGVVHRDIKPSNLLLDQTGKIWVADFGLARCQGNAPLTAQGDRVGTARYMSPEQAAGRVQEIDFRTDIYSLGITLYEILTLCHAFEGANREQLLQSIEVQEPLSPRKRNPAISLDLETILLKAVSKQASERYASAGELADDLRRYLDGKPTIARRPTCVDRLSKWAWRRKRAVAACFVGLVGFSLCATTAAVMIARQHREQVKATAQAHFHLQQAHQVVDRFGGLLVDQFAAFPGGEHLRAELLQEALGYYRDFICYAEHDPALRHELAKTRVHFANALQRGGRMSEALQEYDQALLDFASIPHRSSQSPYSADAALCYQLRGGLQLLCGRYREAESDFLHARDIQSNLLQVKPVEARIAVEYTQTLNQLAMLAWSTDQLSLAESYLDEAVQTLENLLHSSGSVPPEAYELLYECRNNYVAVLSESDPDRAVSLLTSSLAQARQQQATFASAKEPVPSDHLPGPRRYQVQIANMQTNLAALHARRGNDADAELLLKQALAEWERQGPTASPADTALALQPQKDVENGSPSEPGSWWQGRYESWADMANAHNNLGEIYWRQRRWKDSQQEFDSAERLLRDSIVRSPHAADSFSRLAGVLHNQGLLASAQGKLPDAMQYLTQALDTQAQAMKMAPYNSRYRAMFEAHQSQLDQTLHSLQASAKE